MSAAPATPPARARAFSVARWWSMVTKEFLQLRRDRITFGMIVGIPIIQLTLFGYAINSDPRHMPTAVIAGETSEFTRSVIAVHEQSTQSGPRIAVRMISSMATLSTPKERLRPKVGIHR